MEYLTFRVRRGRKERYWSMCTKQELIKRLAEYEDTGLDPEEIWNLKKRDAAAAAITETNPERTLFRCPTCGNIYMILYSDGLRVGKIPEFCQDCGQRLKKGMENEIHRNMEQEGGE